MAEVAVSRQMFNDILRLVAQLRALPGQYDREMGSDATDDDSRGAP